MDKSWVHLDRRTPEYFTGMKSFLDVAFAKVAPRDQIVCPCVSCCNRKPLDRRTIEVHLVVKGMWSKYINSWWRYHGEPFAGSSHRTETGLDESGGTNADGMREFLNETFVQPIIGENIESSGEPHIFEGPTPEAENFYKFLEDANTELYPGCKFKKLEAIVRLYQIKCLGGATDRLFTMFLDFIKQLLPEGECLPKSFYETKKLISELGLSYEKIDACPNDCMLYWKDRSNLTECSTCGASRYVVQNNSTSSTKRVSAKVLRYFPLIPRLKRLYMSKHTAEHMRWHATECPKDGFMRHPSDSPAWKNLDSKYPDFGSEMRNVRLGLASDGFNPFGNMSSDHSTWPVVLSVFNLPPWMCMKQSNLFLSLLIPGPNGPGNDIDVYLEPLIDELKELWEVGATTYDVFSNQRFTMKAALLWTINDFPAYGNLSGWSTHGFKACPHCMDKTDSLHLGVSKKLCYPGGRKFLPIDHSLRASREGFIPYHRFHTSRGEVRCKEDYRVAPKQLTGMQCLAQLNTLTFTFGKVPKPMAGQRKRRRVRRVSSSSDSNTQWRKKSIFFELPYWKDNLLRHNLDLMHIEKNWFVNIVGTVFNIKGMTKDGINSRGDLELLDMRSELHPKRGENKTYLPPALFTASKDEKDFFFGVFSDLRVPDGYSSSNLSRFVNDKKMRMLKSHDCHVIMQQLLAIAVRHILPRATRHVLMEVSAIFRQLCYKKLSPDLLVSLKERVAVVLCQIEKIFPPSFFTIMVHLLTHLPEEAAIAGPVQFRWMYPIERYLCTLKKYVRNKSRPEGSIAEGYIVEESLSYCSMYLSNVETRRTRPSRNADSDGRGISGGLNIFGSYGYSKGKGTRRELDQKTWEHCRRTVLFNCEECQPFIEQCLNEVKQTNRRKPMRELELIRNKIFPDWFKQRVNGLYEAHDPSISTDLRWLANGPSKIVTRYNTHVVNGFRFRVKSVDDTKKNQNCGVFYTATTACYSSARDPNPRVGDVEYYGVLQDIYELNYGGPTEGDDRGRKVVLFNCDWVDSTSRRGKKLDSEGFTLVNFNELLRTEDTFLLASSAVQAFYVKDKKEPNWHVAATTQPRDFYDVNSGTETDGTPNIENPFTAPDHYATLDMDHELIDVDGEYDTREDVTGVHVDETLPLPTRFIENENDEDDLYTNNEDDAYDEDDLYDDIEY